MEESEILDQSFQLIFAFDEIVALGYRESVNLAQIRTFTEMDSHEEKVYQAVRQVRYSRDGWASQLIHKGLVFIKNLAYGNSVGQVLRQREKLCKTCQFPALEMLKSTTREKKSCQNTHCQKKKKRKGGRGRERPLTTLNILVMIEDFVTSGDHTLILWQTQEKEAKEHMKRMAKELQQQRREGRRMPGLSGIGSNSMGRNDSSVITDNIPHEPSKPSYVPPS